MITWSETYATGHPQIDEEHRILIDRLNELESALMSGQGKVVIEPMLAFLEEYAAIHFRNEEECFARHRCPAAAENKAAHDSFMRTFAEAKKQLEAKGITVSLVLGIHRQLADWVRNHILRTDVKLRPCLTHSR